MIDVTQSISKGASDKEKLFSEENKDHQNIIYVMCFIQIFTTVFVSSAQIIAIVSNLKTDV